MSLLQPGLIAGEGKVLNVCYVGGQRGENQLFGADTHKNQIHTSNCINSRTVEWTVQGSCVIFFIGGFQEVAGQASVLADIGTVDSAFAKGLDWMT